MYSHWKHICRVALAACLVAAAAAAQTDPAATGWQKELIADWTTTQTAYSDSWVGGEAGSFSWVANLKGKAEKQLHPKFNFRSNLKMSYGQTMSQDAESGDWKKPQKSTDLIDWDNIGLITLQGYVDPFVGFRVETQFMDASAPAKKRYLTPMKLTESAGIARRYYKKDKDEVFSRFGVAFKQTISKDIVAGLIPSQPRATALPMPVSIGYRCQQGFQRALEIHRQARVYKALAFSKKDDFKGTEFEDD
jgi:hypothetical protein